MKTSQIAATALALSIGAGGYAVGRGLAPHTDSASGRLSSASTPTTTPVTTPQPPSPAPTTTVPVTHHNPVESQGPTPPQPHTTRPTIVVSKGRCGTGTATATASVQIDPARATADTDYVESGTVHLANAVDKPITLDQLVVHLDYGDGSFETVVPAGADNLGLAPGESKDLSFSRTTARPVQSVSIAGFGYHTTGQAQCAAVPA
jgi:hypothetical protein